MKRLLISVVLAYGLWAAGCGDVDSPPPQFNYGVKAGGRMLLPTVVPKQLDSSILGAAVSPEEAGAVKAAPAGEAAANVIKIQIDDSTPEGLIKSFIAIIDSKNLAQLPDVVVPEQRAVVQEIAGTMGPFLQASESLRVKLAEKFPDTPLPGMSPGTPGMNFAESVKLAGVEAQGDTEAEATVEVTGQGQPEKIRLKKVETAWRVELPKVPSDEELAQFRQFAGSFGELAKAMQDIIRRMDNNEFATAEQAQQAIGEATTKILMPMLTAAMSKMQAGQEKIKAGEAVPDVTLTATDGTAYKLSDLRGKYVFLDFWASWCMPCVAEIPNVKALREATRDRSDFVLLGVNMDRSQSALDSAVKKHGIDWPQVFGPNSGAKEAGEAFGVAAIPYTCLIGPDGKLIAQHLRGPGLADEVKLALAGAPTSKAPAEVDTAVRQSFAKYKQALLAADGPAAAAILSSNTVQWYEQCRTRALSMPRDELQRLSLIDQMTILKVRQDIPREKIEALDGRKLVELAVQKGWIGGESVGRLEIDSVYLKGTAEAGISFTKLPGVVAMRFVQEDSRWRFDLTHTFGQVNAALRVAARQSGLSDTDFIISALQKGAGRTPDPRILDGPLGEADFPPAAGSRSQAPPPKPKSADNTRPKSELEQDVDNAAARSALGGGI